MSAPMDSQPTGVASANLIIELNESADWAALELTRAALGLDVIAGENTTFQLWSAAADSATAATAIGSISGVANVGLDLPLDLGLADISTAPEDGGAPNEILPSATSNDPLRGYTYGLDKIGAQAAWDTTTGDASVVVGVIDTGIDIDHPDLRNNIWINTDEIWGDGIDNDGNGYVDDFNGYDFVRNQGIGPGYAYDDEHGHGTHVAGTIAAEGNNGIGVSGVAWDASLMALKFLNAYGGGYTYNATRAVRYATDNGADMTNNSWGGGGYSSSLSLAISEARTAGVLFVAAAGNSNVNTDSSSHYPSSYSHDNVISVGSTTSSDSRSYFSNYGRTTVDLAAPGSSIYSTARGGGYTYMSGTSMATPHVTGALALMKSLNPTATYSELRQALLDSTDSISSFSGRSVTEGRLNVDAALEAIGASMGPVTDIALSSSLVSENATGAIVGFLSSTGGDGAVSYGIDSDPSGIFTVTGNTLSLRSGVSLDHEAADQHTVVLRATDSSTQSYTETMTINVADVNEAPTDIGGSILVTLYEDEAIGRVLGTLAAVGDQDENDSHEFSLVDDHGGRFSIGATSGVLTVSGALDHETADGHSLTIRATDQGGLSAERTTYVQVRDVNEAPEIGDQLVQVFGGATIEGVLSGIDPEGDAVTFGLVSDAANGTAIVDQAGAFSYTSDAAFAGEDTFTVFAEDAAALRSEAKFTVTVHASAADTHLEGSDANDFIANNSTGRTIDGGAGEDTLLGGDGADRLIGGSGADSLSGGGGDDVLVFDAADVLIDGGDGQDTAILKVGRGIINASLGDGTIQTDDTIQTLASIERVELDISDAGFAAGLGTSPAGGEAELSSASPAGGDIDLIIAEDASISSEALSRTMATIGAVQVGQSGSVQFWDILDDTIDIDAAIADMEFASFVSKNDSLQLDTLAVEEVVGPDATRPSDPSYGSLYGMERISAPDAWDTRTDASSVVVGVIDTGIDVDHPDLINNMWVNAGEIWGDGIDNDNNGYVDDYHGYDFFNNVGIGPTSNGDGHGHGTHVAGTIAAEGNNGIGVSGVAWQAQLMAVKVFSDSGSTYTSALINGINYATMMGAQVTNNSWGGGGYSSGIVSAINDARDAGSIFVAASGNDSGQNTDVLPHYPSSYNHDNIVSVASTTSSDGLSSFSNHGATTVDLGAPGSDIFSTYRDGGYATISGTSMATPHVTGAIALVLAEDPSLTYSEAIDAVLDNVDQVSSLDGITVTGGRLNVDAALDAVAETPSPLALSSYDMVVSSDLATVSQTITASESSGVAFTLGATSVGSAELVGSTGGTRVLNYTLGAGDYSESFTIGAEGATGDTTNTISVIATSGDLTGTDANTMFFGDDEADTIRTGLGSDIVLAGDGDDLVVFSGGTDQLDGGLGNDTLDLSGFASTISLNLSAGTFGASTVENFENVIGGDGNNNIVGTNGSNEISGGDSYDILSGMDGDDVLSGGDGGGRLYGGDGNDFISGGDGGDRLEGGDGNDTLSGGDGEDYLYGGDGDDVFFAGDGHDYVDGGTGSDTLNLGYLSGTFSLDMGAGTMTGSGVSGTVTGTEFGTIGFHDIERIVYVDASGGVVMAGSGAEIFADTYGATIDYGLSESGITLDFSNDIGTGTGGAAEGDTFIDAEAVRGSSHDDVISFGAANMSFDGGDGVDTVHLRDALADLAISESGGTFTVTESDGAIHTLTNVERLGFADGDLDLTTGPALFLSGSSVDENLAAGATVSTISVFSVTDEVFTLSLTDDAGGLFAFDSATGIVTTTAALDHEEAASYALTFRATSDQGSDISRTTTISVGDVNEAPTDLNEPSFSATENAVVGTVIGTATVTDPDEDDTHTFTLSDDAGGRFSIDGDTGVLRVAGAVDHEANEAPVVTIQVTDSGGLTQSFARTVTVADVNEAPIDLALSAANISEHAAIGQSIGVASATDQDDGDSVTYTLTDSAGGRFTIDEATGILRVAASLDHEAAASHGVTVRATDTEGLSLDRAFTIAVDDENDAPNAQADAALAQEEQPLTLSPSALLANDSDPDGDTLTISTVGNAVNGSVAIDGDGNIVFTPNAETIGAAAFDYTVSDGRGGVDTVTVDITIEASPIEESGGDGSDTLRGGSDSDRLSGGAGDDVMFGRRGDDVLMGGTGDDVYVFRAGDGTDTIDEYASETVTDTRQVQYTYTTSHRTWVSTGESGFWRSYTQQRVGTRTEEFEYYQQIDAGNDTLRFGAGIAASDISAVMDGQDLVLTVGGAGGASIASTDSLRLKDWMDGQQRIENFEFEDAPGQVLDAAGILERFGTDGADTLTWTESALRANGRGGNDTITAGAFDDVLTGGAGDDVLSGGDGTDEAVYSGRLEDYVLDISNAAAGTVGVTDNRGTDGSDTLHDIEVLRFSDGTLALTGGNIAPFARNDTVTTDEDVPLRLTGADLHGNDLSMDGDPLTITAVGGANGGAVSLDGSGGVVFTPTANASGIGGFTYTVSDGAGGQSTGTVEVTVNAVNDAPTAIGDTATGTEDTPLTLTAASLIGNDSDIDGDALTLSAVGGASNGAVTLDGDTVIFTPDADFSGAASFTYDLDDGNGGAATGTVALDIAATNDAPTDIGLTGGSVAEDAPIGAVVGTATAVDIDGGDSHAFTLSDDAGGRFAIDRASGVISVASALDFETDGAEHIIGVTATDTGGESVTRSLTLTLGDVNEAPVSDGMDATSVGENAVVGTAVGTASANDVDAGESLTFSLTDNAGGLFSIDAETGIVSVAGALDYETATSHAIGIRATDTGGLTAEWTETISVADGNDAPIPEGVSMILREGVSASLQVGATDPNGDAVTFSPVSSTLGAASMSADGTLTFTSSGGTGTEALSVDAHDNGGLTGTSEAQISVIGRATDALVGTDAADVIATDDSGDTLSGLGGNDDLRGGGGADVATFRGNMADYALSQDAGAIVVADSVDGRDGTDRVTDVEVLSFADGTLNVDGGVVLIAGDLSAIETATPGASVGSMSLLNFTGGAVTMRLLDDAGGRFTLDADTGEITVAGGLDFESAESHDLSIGIFDATDTELARRAVSIAVGDANEAPTSAGLDGKTISEAAALGAVVGTASANDPDSGDSHTFSLADDAGGRFTINAATGVVSLAAALDHETAAAHAITIRATDSGGLTRDWTETLSVTDANDAPHAATVTFDGTVSEAATIGTVLGTVTASDVDAGETLTFSLTDDAGGAVAIDGATGVMTLASLLDFETAASLPVTARATDAAGATIDASGTLSVGNVDEAPITAPDQIATSEETDLRLPVSTLLGNDADPEGGALTLVSVHSAQNGTVSIDSAGLVVFSPETAYTGAASFDYTVRDAGGNETTQTVAVDVTELQRQLVGGDGDDELNGGSGADTMTGGGGDDTLWGRRGDDIIAGGAGNDTYRFGIGDGGDVIDETVMESQTFSRRVPRTVTGTRTQVITNGETRRTVTSTFSYTVWDTEFYDADVQVDGGTNDTIAFGLGIMPGDVSGRLVDGDLILTVSNAGGGSGVNATDSIVVRDWTSADTRIETLTFESAPDQSLDVAGILGLIGSDDADTITWTETAATLNGRGGADTLTTGAFDDVLTGGAGNDTINGGVGTDAAVFSGDLENYSLSIDGSQIQVTDTNGTDGTDTLSGIEELRFADGTLSVSADGNVAAFSRGDSVAGTEDTALTIAPTSLLANDTSLDGDAMTVTGVGNAANGRVELTAAGIVFTPDQDFSGDASFDYTVEDGRGGVSSATVVVEVAATPDAPNAATLSGSTVNENAAIGTSIGHVSATDPDAGDIVRFGLLSHSSLFAIDTDTGALTVNGALNHEAAGSHEVTVRATDDGGLIRDTVLTVTIGDVNEAPTELTLTGGTVSETLSTGDVIGTLGANDVDDGDAHVYSLDDDDGGRFSIDANTGVLTLTGQLDYETGQQHTVTVRATDAGGLSVISDVDIVVLDVDEAPTTVADTANTAEDTAITLLASDLLANDADPEGGALRIATIASAVGGVAVLTAGGDILFTPDANYFGAAQIDFDVADPGGATTRSRVTLDVSAVNDAPVADSESVATQEETAIAIAFTDILAGDSDVDGDVLSVTGVSNAVGGVASLDAAGERVLFTPNTNFLGAASFDYTVSDGNGGTATATIAVNVVAVDQALTGTADADSLIAASGDDSLFGLEGADTLHGRRGTDRLEGGAGDDVYRFDLGDGSDTIVDHATVEETQTTTETYSYSQAYQVWVSNGETRQSVTRYRTVTGTREITTTEIVDTNAGNDTVEFGTGVASTDLGFSFDQDDLLVSIAGSVTDQLRLTDWRDTNRQIETLRFTDEATVLTATDIEASASAAALRLASAMAGSPTSGIESDVGMVDEDNSLFPDIAPNTS